MGVQHLHYKLFLSPFILSVFNFICIISEEWRKNSAVITRDLSRCFVLLRWVSQLYHTPNHWKRSRKPCAPRRCWCNTLTIYISNFWNGSFFFANRFRIFCDCLVSDLSIGYSGINAPSLFRYAWYSEGTQVCCKMETLIYRYDE